LRRRPLLAPSAHRRPGPAAAPSARAASDHRAAGVRSDVHRRRPLLPFRLPRPRHLRAAGEPGPDDAACGGAAPGHRAAFSVLSGLHFRSRVRQQPIQLPSLLLIKLLGLWLIEQSTPRARRSRLPDSWKTGRLADSCLLADSSSGLLPLPGFAKPAAEQTAQQNSMQDAAADRARYEDVTDEKSPNGLL